MDYTSKYYDPSKAHEYYERTKVLKGYENRYGGSRGNGTSAASSGSMGPPKLSGIANKNQRSSTAASVRTTQTKGSSGFDQKKTDTITYTKEHIDVVRKVNKIVDNEILDKVKKLREDIDTIRESDQGFSSEELAARIKAMLGETKKIKTKAMRKIVNEYI